MDRAMRRQATIGEAHEPEPASWLACAGGLLVLLIGVWLYGRVAVLVIAAVDQMFVAVGVAPDVVALGHDQAEWTLSLELRLLSLLSLGRAAAAAVAPRVARSYREYCRRYFGAGGSIPVRCAVGFWVYRFVMRLSPPGLWLGPEESMLETFVARSTELFIDNRVLPMFASTRPTKRRSFCLWFARQLWAVAWPIAVGWWARLR